MDNRKLKIGIDWKEVVSIVEQQGFLVVPKEMMIKYATDRAAMGTFNNSEDIPLIYNLNINKKLYPYVQHVDTLVAIRDEFLYEAAAYDDDGCWEIASSLSSLILYLVSLSDLQEEQSATR